MRKRQKQAKRYEQEQARKHRGKHQGGPGQPDYTRGRVKAEVKHWQRPVDSEVVRKAKEKGIKEIVSISGFTSPAIEEAKKAGIRLFNHGKRLT